MRRIVMMGAVALMLVGGMRGAGSAEGPTSATAALSVGVDPRVELISIIFRLAGNPEYGRCGVPLYGAAIKSYFKPVEGHAIVKLARALRSQHGVSYDAPMGLAVRLPELATWREGVELTVDTQGLDERWRADDVKAFLALLPGFVKEAKFEQFLKNNEYLYNYTAQQAREMLRGARLEWFDQFYGKRSDVRFHFAPALVNGGSCYGVKSRQDGVEHMYCLMGVWSVNLLGMPKFDEEMISTVVHEFSHSYCNPVVDAHMAELKEAGERMFPAIRTRMSQQAYGHWTTVMYESMVRAAEVRYAAATKGDEAARKAAEYNAGRGFTWTGDLADLLKGYEADRKKYPTLDAFFPEIVKFFDKTSKDVAAARAKAPLVAGLTPENGARDVDPGLKELVVTFDREMSPGSYAWTGGGPSFPELPEGSKPYWKDAKTCALPVKLQPGKTYTFGINGGRFTGFRAKDGTPAEAVVVTFRTRGQ